MAILEFFKSDQATNITMLFGNLADSLATTLEGPEVTAGLRKLLEAKDCMVRAQRSKTATVAADPEEPGPDEKQIFLRVSPELVDGSSYNVHHPVKDCNATGLAFMDYVNMFSVQDVESGGVTNPTIELIVMTQAEVDALPEI